MPVYVDQARNPFGRMIMCHMIADTPAELHEMAKKIGMKKKWYQPRSFPHYDLAKFRRQRALEEGAIECDRRTFVRHMRRIRESEAF